MNPIVSVGTRFDISGHIAKVTAIRADGVECELGNRKITIAFSQVETALDQAAKQPPVEEKPKKQPAKKVEDKTEEKPKRTYRKRNAESKEKGKSNARSRSRKSDKSN